MINMRGLRQESEMAAALKFIKNLMERHGTAKKITTDGLR
jgi:transposase-like protein